MAGAKISSRSPWFWIPTLYVAEGLPYALAMSVSLVLYKNLGVSNTDIAFYTSWLYLPWVIKPLWSPVVDLLKTRRLWIWMTQLLLGAGMVSATPARPAPRSNCVIQIHNRRVLSKSTTGLHSGLMTHGR